MELVSCWLLPGSGSALQCGWYSQQHFIEDRNPAFPLPAPFSVSAGLRSLYPAVHSVVPSHLGVTVHAPSRRCCGNMLGFLQGVYVTLSSQDPHQSLPHQPWGGHLCSDAVPHLLSILMIAALGNHFRCEKIQGLWEPYGFIFQQQGFFFLHDL